MTWMDEMSPIYEDEWPEASTYTGAPDECSQCWPNKIHEGPCNEGASNGT